MDGCGFGKGTRLRLWALLVLAFLCAISTGCSGGDAVAPGSGQAVELPAVEQVQKEDPSIAQEEGDAIEAAVTAEGAASLDLASTPAYSGSPYVQIFDNRPQFTDEEKARPGFEEYSQLDSLGRCGVVFALIGTETMPTEERGSIGMVRPSGWRTVRYDGLVDGNYLYNRCHLIGYQLAGENANERNLITGTRYLNVEGMLPFESEVADYVERTGNHVLYRVTPVFEGDDLVASGVEMESWSVEDSGAGVSFNVYCYNVQPGVDIDYATGGSSLAVDTQAEAASEERASTSAAASDAAAMSYVLNTNTKRFHLPGCRYADTVSEANREDFTGTREELVSRGYEPCKVCAP